MPSGWICFKNKNRGEGGRLDLAYLENMGASSSVFDERSLTGQGLGTKLSAGMLAPCQAAAKGARLKDGLSIIDSPAVREVRGMGLMVAMELKSKAGPYLAALAEQGVLALSAGANVMRFLPPLVITEEEVDRMEAEANRISRVSG